MDWEASGGQCKLAMVGELLGAGSVGLWLVLEALPALASPTPHNLDAQ